MGRRKDPEKQALIEKLGVSTAKNWTKAELLEMEKRQKAKEAKSAEKEAIAELVAGKIPSNLKPAELPIPYDLREIEDPFSGLTERQKRIARYRMRGMSQQAIANLEHTSQPVISQELKKIKEWQIERGANVDQAAIVGNALSLYEEVEHSAWLLYGNASEVGDKAKLLAVIMSARDKHNKLLTDLGLLKKAGQEIKHTIEVSEFIQNWKDGSAKKALADSLVMGQLKALPEPELDPEIIDAVIEPNPPTNDVEITELKEPELDDDEALSIDDD